MKNRFLATTICLVLVLAVLPLAAFSQSGGGLFKPVSVAPMSATKPETPSVVNPSVTYDGIYSGKFNYEYRENRLEKVPGGPPYPIQVSGEWIPASFRLTVTIKTTTTPMEAKILGWIGVEITSVTCSDPNFGTGPFGITLDKSAGGNLPADSSDIVIPVPINPSQLPTLPASELPRYIVITFPNGAYLETYPQKGEGALSASSEGRTLSGSYWHARTPKGLFSGETLKYEDGSSSKYARYDAESKGWSLTRVGSLILSAAEDNQAKLDAAIKAGDIKDIVEAMKSAKSGLIPEPEATRQWEQGLQALGNINQEKLDAAIKAKDVNGIADAMKFAMSGLVPVQEAKQQEEQAQQGLGNINQERLDAAIKAKDANGIAEAMKFATSGLIPAQEKAQTQQAEEALAKLGGPTVTPSAKSTEGATLTGKSGEVKVKKGGAGEFTEYDQTGLKPGDEVRTGENSGAYIVYSDSYELTLGPTTSITIVDLDKGIDLLLGEIKLSVQKWFKRFEVKTGITTCSVRGTEFTVSVDKDGTTTVMVLEGFVEVQDITSGNGVTVQPAQMITVPKVLGGLTQQDILARVKIVQPESIDRWWEKDLSVTGKQPAPAPWTIVFVVLAAAAIIFLAAGQVFALLLRRRALRG